MDSNTFVHIWWNIQALPWGDILSYVGGSGFIVAVTQFVKVHLNNKTKAKILSVVGVLAFIPDLLNQLVSNPQWAAFLPPNFAWLFSGAVALHALLETPPFRKLRTVLNQYKQALSDVKAQNATPAPSVPVITAPIEPVEETVFDPTKVIQG